MRGLLSEWIRVWHLGVIICLNLVLANLFAAGDGQATAQPAAGPDAAPPLPYRPTEEYEVRSLLGWKLYVSPDLLEDKPLAERVFAELERQLRQICEVVPAEALEKIRRVPIWVEKEEGHHPCMAYHPNPEWLRAHGMNPDKAKCVEIAGARNFVSWTRAQPWMVLHELAHAYHDQFLPGGFRNRRIRERFEQVKSENLYQEVAHVNGRRQRAYALKDVTEFFAETSEAFFGKNDFYPFNKKDLKEYDPQTYSLLAELWGVEDPGEPKKPGKIGESVARQSSEVMPKGSSAGQ